MTITERIERAITERHQQMMKPTAVVLGPLEAGEFFAWLIDQPHVRLGSRWEEQVFTMTIKDIEGMTYNGLPIRLSENDGIDILT